MASDGNAGAISAASAVLSSQASDPTKFQPASGKTLPQSGNSAAPPAASSVATAAAVFSQSSKTSLTNTAPTSVANAAGRNANSNGNAKQNAPKATAVSTSDPQALAAQLNKVLNNSGRADQFRVDPTSEKYIQQVNPASGEVIAEYSVSEFPALARSIGASGLLVDDTA